MGNHIHIIGGGTFSHVRNHLALAAPAFGTTARNLYGQLHRLIFAQIWEERGIMGDSPADNRAVNTEAAQRVTLHLTKMAAPHQSNLVTNEDVSKLLDTLIADPETRVIIMNAALCDYDGSVEPGQKGENLNIKSGPHAPRLKTMSGNRLMFLTAAEKLIGKIRKNRKDIFVVGFKTTTGATSDEQYQIALNMLKRDSLNLVLANDTVTRNNMIVAPEETRYFETTDREEVLAGLVKMVMSRSTNTFTRSTVEPGSLYKFQTDSHIPENLRQVVNHLVERGAYKTFRKSTAGHFAVRLDDGRCLTSRRKTNYNVEGGLDLVEVEYEDDNKVIAFGAKPSVGGQSQRIVFREHPGFDCIVHMHVMMRDDHPDDIPVVEQWVSECGSMTCGKRTSDGLRLLEPGIKGVMLEPHGPNIVFTRETPAENVVAFIERNFDLSTKTGGLLSSVG
jgi:hypothetical protein